MIDRRLIMSGSKEDLIAAGWKPVSELQDGDIIYGIALNTKIASSTTGTGIYIVFNIIDSVTSEIINTNVYIFFYAPTNEMYELRVIKNANAGSGSYSTPYICKTYYDGDNYNNTVTSSYDSVRNKYFYISVGGSSSPSTTTNVSYSIIPSCAENSPGTATSVGPRFVGFPLGMYICNYTLTKFKYCNATGWPSGNINSNHDCYLIYKGGTNKIGENSTHREDVLFLTTPIEQ